MTTTPCPVPETCQLEKKVDDVLKELQALRTAFPETDHGEADIIGHRRYHDAKIAAAKAEEAFWNELKLDLAKKGAWALLTIIVGLVLTGLAVKLGLASFHR